MGMQEKAVNPYAPALSVLSHVCAFSSMQIRSDAPFVHTYLNGAGNLSVAISCVMLVTSKALRAQGCAPGGIVATGQGD